VACHSHSPTSGEIAILLGGLCARKAPPGLVGAEGGAFPRRAEIPTSTRRRIPTAVGARGSAIELFDDLSTPRIGGSSGPFQTPAMHRFA
jgi:hypothetical protein